MRIFACGTGMPTARPKQAATCFLVELGNGDKFVFDMGTGSTERLSALRIPWDFLDKAFIGHLHTDHFGDFDALYIGGWVGGRNTPFRVWGPSGQTPEFGTKYALEKIKEGLTWDIEGRKGNIPASGGKLEIHEFDYKGENQVVYQENGVTIRSWPAIHAIDGSVSYSLEWNGLKFVFGSDTYPNKWFTEYAKDADLVIHECFITVQQLIDKYKWSPQTALQVGTQVHTAPEATGKVFSIIKPRMAVAYHFFNDFNTRSDIERRIRTTYDGPLSLATDYMVWNVTKDKIRVRMTALMEDVWPPAPATIVQPPDPKLRIPKTEFLEKGKLEITDVIQPIYDEINKKYSLSEKPGTGE
jgi:ribonuclease Z